MPLAQVIELNNKSDLSNIYIKDYIDFYISKKSSHNTKVSYTTDINQFFNYCFNMPLQFITLDMLRKLSSQKAQSFFIDMINGNKYCEVSIDRKLNSIKTLLNDMTQDIIEGLEEPYLKNNPLATFKFTVKQKSSYGYFTHEEMLKIIDIAYKDNKELGLYFSILYKTSCRSQCILNLNANNLYTINGKYRLKVIDKGDKVADCEIGERLYNECLSCLDDKGQIFHFSLIYALNKLCGKTTYKSNGQIKTNFKNTIAFKIGLTEEECSKEQRYLCLHSIKKSGVTTVLNNSGSVVEASKQGHHSNLQYVLTYTNSNKQEDTSKYIDLDNKNDINDKLKVKLDNMSKDDIINMIMQMDEVTKNRILNVEA